MEIRAWLDSIGLGQYAAAFEEHAVGWDVLEQLDQDLLKDIGVRPAGDRLRILNAIAANGVGSRLVLTLAAGGLPQQASGSGSAERRHMTVVFCDLVGSTELAHRLELEDLRELIGSYQGVCQSAVRRYDGFIARYVGDAVLAYFGYPQAHEEDAERAVRASLAILDGMKALNERAPMDDRVRLSVRIGIATGPVVVGDVIGQGAAQTSAVIGEAPNVAARLQGLAPPDTIVIAPETRRLAQSHFEYRDLGEQFLKGLPAPVRAWQVLGERTVAVRFDARQMSGSTPFVGRKEELALLLSRWQRVKDGEGQVVLLSGEPGIGKSRLAQMLHEAVAGESTALVRYQCSPYHTNSALYPILEQFLRNAGIANADDSRTKIEKMERSLKDAFEDVSTVAPLFAAALSLDGGDRYPVSHLRPEAQKDATLKAMVGLLLSFRAERATLLVIEDVHWIDPTTQEVLDRVVREVAQHRVLALLTHRPDSKPVWSNLANVMALPLVRLERRDTSQMIGELTRGKTLPREVTDQILAKTDGVPLFVEELTKAVLESGQIVETEDAYVVNDALTNLSIPATLHDSLMARLDGATLMRQVAQVGGCIGRLFSLDLLARVITLDFGALNDTLGQLEAAGLLSRTVSSDGILFEFKHALVRDVAYGSLLRGERKRIHARIAQVLAESGDTVVSAPEVLAYHHAEAAQFRQSTLHWRAAAERASARFANAEAIAHCKSGLATHARTPRDAQEPGIELALRLCLAEGLRITDSYAEALAELGTAEAVATEYGLDLALSRIHHLRGNIYYPLGKIENCFSDHEAAWHFARMAGSVEDEARCLGGLGDAHFLAARIRQAHRQFDDCVALARANGSLQTEVAYLPMRAVTHMYCLRFADSLLDCRSVIDLVSQVGRARGELISRSTSGWILADQHELEMAEEHARKGLEAAEQIGARRFIPLLNDVIVRIRLHAGDAAGALDLLEQSWSISRETSVAFAGPVVLGAVALVTTDPGRRFEALRQGEAILNDGCPSHNHYRFYRDAVEVSLREQFWDMAETYANAMERHFSPEGSPWSDFFAARGLALAAAGREGRQGPARVQLKQLQDQAARLGLRAALAGLDSALAKL